MEQATLLHTRPAFCQYADGPCDQDFSDIRAVRGLFLFASKPGTIAGTIESAANRLEDLTGDIWRTWKALDVGGRVIFCEICKAIRGADTVFADVTTLNFNLLFELGFCIGLNVPVQPIRDSSYGHDRKLFKALGVLETIGYLDFNNADELASAAQAATGKAPLSRPPKKTYRETPLYVLKGPVNTEGAIRMMSTLKKSALRFRTFDPQETPWVSLHHHWKQVHGSYGVFAHLLSPNRDGALVHNALCAFLCGIALAEEKAVLLLQEEGAEQPIDYRDIVRTYDRPEQVPGLLERPITEVFERLQDDGFGVAAPPSGLLTQIDLGDTAAENEIAGLKEYFVPTGQFTKAMQGHARLVVGRKGAGKTALFYAVRGAAQRGHETLVLDMKPEGHQFTRLREAVLEELTPGQREYTIAAFWTYLLSAEVAHKILNNQREYQAAQRDPERYERYRRLQDAYLAHGLASGDDFSQRLLRQVDRISERFGAVDKVTARTDLTELVYGGDIRTLNDAVAEYVSREKEEVWLLIDNLDKSWVTRGTTREDMAILLGLLEASVSLERQFEKRRVDFRCLVFIRTDILDHLNRETADRGKETTISLDWDDLELFREIARKRICASTELEGDFNAVWANVAEPTVGSQDSFAYMVERTLMRPRDMLLFLQQAVEVATNRGHDRIRADDIRHAENGFSEGALLWLTYEIEDTNAQLAMALYSFHGAPLGMGTDEVSRRLVDAGIPADDVESAIDLLLWFGFLGIRRAGTDEEEFAYQTQFNLRKLLHPVHEGRAKFVVHRGFRPALSSGL